MSAITGIFFRDDNQKSNPEVINEMNQKLCHRGPDGSDIWIGGSVAFGHQMLWTTPESLQEILPFHDKKAGLVITADARIDNRKELSKELNIDDNEDISDSYFILKSFEKWHEECPKYLLGDFAFAIWDENEAKLFCARDHMGIKPFYYYVSNDIFAFATEMKALLLIPTVTKELNEKKLALFLIRDFLDKEDTFFKNIKSLPAAHSLKINKNQFTKEEYWVLDPELNMKMDSEEEYAKAFREIFAKAIQCRLRSYFPIGFELSGGLDSSSITCFANNILNEERDSNPEIINTFSRVYDEIPESDESPYIKKVLETGHFKPNFFNGDSISPLKNINDIFWHQDQPFFSPNMTNQVNSYEKISERGVRILFSGEGGDETVSHGGNYIRELLFTFKFNKFIKELKETSNNSNENIYMLMIREVIFPSIPYFIKKYIKIIFKKNTVSIINKNFIENSGIGNVDFNRFLDKIGKLKTKEYHYFSINNPLNQTVFGITDRSASIYNIEERYPFYDKRVIEFCYALPTEMKIKHGWDRYVLRIAMQDILPPEIQWRSQKANLSYVYKRNLLLYEKNTIDHIVYDDNIIIKNYVDIKTIKTILEEYKSGKKEKLFDFWLVILIYLWIKYTELV